jgi:hypothetical protein
VAGGVAGAILIDFARFALVQADRAARAEVARVLVAYWRSRDLGPVPRSLEAWAAVDAAHDAELARRRAEAGR